MLNLGTLGILILPRFSVMQLLINLEDPYFHVFVSIKYLCIVEKVSVQCLKSVDKVSIEEGRKQR